MYFKGMVSANIIRTYFEGKFFFRISGDKSRWFSKMYVTRTYKSLGCIETEFFLFSSPWNGTKYSRGDQVKFVEDSL